MSLSYVIRLNVNMLNVIKLNFNLLSVIKLSAVILSVVAPWKRTAPTFAFHFQDLITVSGFARSK
jgi:hypothetical protein